MLNPQIEFFKTDSGTNMVKVDNREYHEYEAFETLDFVNWFYNLLTNEEKNWKCAQVIADMKNHGMISKIEMVKIFRECNLDTLDNKPDITHEGVINPEYVQCKFKQANKRCPHSQPGNPKPYCIIKRKALIPVK